MGERVCVRMGRVCVREEFIEEEEESFKEGGGGGTIQRCVGGERSLLTINN